MRKRSSSSDSRSSFAKKLSHVRHAPSLKSQDAIDGLRREALALAEAQQGPEPAIPEGRMLLDEVGHREYQLERQASGPLPGGRTSRRTVARFSPTTRQRRRSGVRDS